VSALVSLCDRECSFVWLPSFLSNVFCDLSYGFMSVVLSYLFHLVLFTVIVL